jgi:hypothetical protein
MERGSFLIFFNRRKNDVCVVCGLVNGHLFGINLRDGLIWGPNFSNALELTVINVVEISSIRELNRLQKYTLNIKITIYTCTL